MTSRFNLALISLVILLYIQSLYQGCCQTSNQFESVTIDPPETIWSGGIEIKVQASNFTNLQVKFSIALLASDESVTWYNSEEYCTHISDDTVLLCTTPRLVHTNTTIKQQCEARLLIDEKRYRLNQSITVYPDPVFVQFSPYNMSYNQAKPKIITIQLTGQIEGFRARDIGIEVGRMNQKSQGVCEDITVNAGMITCKPPQISPDIIQYDTADQYTLPVMVTIGYSNTTQVGNLVYEDKGFPVIIVIMIIILGLIVIISVFIGLLTLCGCNTCSSCCKHGSSSSSDKHQLFLDDPAAAAYVDIKAGGVPINQAKRSSDGTKLSFEPVMRSEAYVTSSKYTPHTEGVDNDAYQAF